MVRVREARRAYRDFHAQCFWSYDPELVIGVGDVAWVVEQLLRRRGKYRDSDFARLRLTEPVDLRALKTRWLAMLGAAEAFVLAQPEHEIGCLYWSFQQGRFVEPGVDRSDAVPHYGRPAGVLRFVANAA